MRIMSLLRSIYQTKSSWTYLIITSKLEPVLWNLPYLNLERLPIIDATQHTDFKWFSVNLELQFTHLEYEWYQSEQYKTRPQESRVDAARIEFKRSLSSVFQRFVHDGITGSFARNHSPSGRALGHDIKIPSVRVMALADDAGIQFVIFVSELRLDTGNKTVVIDAAVSQ